MTSFRGATFSGEVTSFIDATFSGRTEFAVAVVCAGATLQLPRFMDPNSMLAGLRIEAGAKVLVDGKRYTLPDPPKTQEEGSP